MRVSLRLTAFLCCGLTACGPSTNPNKVLYVSSYDASRRLDNLQIKAQAAYDQGDYDTAVTIGEKIVGMDPNNEPAAQFLASAYLGTSGVSPFDLILKLISQAITKTADSAAGKQSSGNSLDILTTLSSLVSIQASDYEILGTLDGLDTNDAYSDYFKNLPVYIPKTPGNSSDTSTPRGQQNTLKNVSKALATLCPFLGSDIISFAQGKITDDRYVCNARSENGSVQTFMIFALSHLIETVFFYSVLLYQSDSTSLNLAATADTVNVNSNLLQRVTKLQTQSTDTNNLDLAKIATFTSAVIQMKQTIDDVFNLEDKTSMLSQTMADLTITVEGFASIKGLPDSVISSLKTALTTITDQASKITNANSTLAAQNQAFAQNLNTNINTGLTKASQKYLDALDDKLAEEGTTLQARIDANATDKAAVEDMCTSLAALSQTSSDVTVPSQCTTLDF